jgi:hypothetical protein
MTTIPDFRAQGLSTSDHNLGATMSGSMRALPRLDSATAVSKRK